MHNEDAHRMADVGGKLYPIEGELPQGCACYIDASRNPPVVRACKSNPINFDSLLTGDSVTTGEEDDSLTGFFVLMAVVFAIGFASGVSLGLWLAN